ncbi:MAG TPA: ABC transporter substrate-binding protein [Streptosporangiaceae bacterium]|nr:ABC transporter substrate-binding protein [Streptosporangiaceae bacterium]
MRALLGRRPAFAAVAGLVMSTLVVGCNQGTAVTDKPVTVASLSGIGPITFATGELDTGSYLPALLRQWNAAHPRQRVTLIPLPDEADDQHAQLVANLQTRSSLYDVMSLDVVWTAEFAASGWIVPLNPRSFPLPDFLRPAVATARFAGRLFAVPFTSNAGLLYYRSDILDAAHASPPRTWAELARLARTLAPEHHMAGYAGQLAPYEGLTVNFAEAVQSAGGHIVSADGTTVTLNSPQAQAGLTFLLDGLKAGWIPRAALRYDEAASEKAFVGGHLLFLRNWPYVYGLAAARGSPVAGKFKVTALPGATGTGSAVLGGANLAISAYSRHQRTALAFIKFLTSMSSEREVLVKGSLPPVWTSLYSDRALTTRFPYLPTLKKAILTARPRPQTPNYSQLSLAISSTVHQALVKPWAAAPGPMLARLARELRSFVRNG